MLKFLLLGMLLSISCAASFAQEPQAPAAQSARANPCASATTQAELNKCSGEEYRKADEHMNVVYRNLMRILREAADDSKKLRDENLMTQAENSIQKLRAAQIAWEQYRTLHCDAVKQQFEGGTIAPLEWATCMSETANHRTAELKSGYEIGDRKLE